jgi:hypothetical protein
MMAYKLHKAIGISFANLTEREFYFQGSLTLCSGGNGAGKSSLLDMIQIVMTGDRSDIINYNAGQKDDSTIKRNERSRSFAAYLLGADQKGCTRGEATGVVSLVFKNDLTGYSFSAWVYSEASTDKNKSIGNIKSGDYKLGFCFNTILSSSEFMVNEDNDSGEIKEFTKLKDYFKTKYSTDFLLCDGKKDYLMKLYGKFNGLVNLPFPEAVKAAKSFVKYINPTKADNINKFVSKELLEEDDLSPVISSLKETISIFNKIEKEANAISKSEEDLSSIVSNGDTVLSLWKEHFEEKYIVKKRKMIRLMDDKQSFEIKLSKLQEEDKESIKIINDAKEKIPQLEKDKKDLETSIEGNETLSKKEQFENQIQNLQIEIAKKEEDIEKSLKDFEAFLTYLRSTEQYMNINDFFGANTLKNLEDANNTKLTIEDRVELYSKNTHILNSTIEDESKFVIKLKDMKFNIDLEFNNITKENNELIDEINSFSLTGSARYPIQKELDSIRENFPEADVVLLCECIDINNKNKDWQRAIEGFLKNNRFAIIVNENYEVEVTDFLKEMDFKKVKVIQGRKVLYDLDRSSKILKSDSIVNLMAFNNDIVEAYMILNYGNVLQIQSTYELTQSRRGLKIDGLAASGYTTFNCLLKEKDCFIGENSRYKRLKLLKQELNSNNERLNIIRPKKTKLDTLINYFIRTRFSNPKLLLKEKEIFIRDLETRQEMLDSLDLANEKEILEKIESIINQIKTLSESRNNAFKRSGSVEKELEHILQNITIKDEIIKQNEIDLHSIESDIRFVFSNDTTDFSVRISNLDEQAKITFQNTMEIGNFDREIKNNIVSFLQASADYTSHCMPVAMIEEPPLFSNFFDDIDSFKRLVVYIESQKNVMGRLSNNLLKSKKDQLTKAKNDFDKTFKDEFCNRVYNSIVEGSDRVKKLNSMLRKHQFGNERFVIKEPFIPLYKEYFDYFEHVVFSRKDSLGSTVEYEDRGISKTKQLIEDLLLSTDDIDSKRKLKDISDYRNYKEYDIHKVFDGDENGSVSLNELATDSGGQATTSYYIIRSIAAYASFDKDNKRYKTGGLGFLLIDEAFNKLDINRLEDIIKYLKETLGFQLITAMPTQDESKIKPFASDRYNITKIIEDNSSENYRISQYSTYDVLNSDEINRLIKDEEKKIRSEFDNNLFNFED